MKTHPFVHENVFAPAVFSWLDNVLERNIGRDMFHHTTPSMNLKEIENGYEVELAAPGFQKENFKIEVEDNLLQISATVEQSEETAMPTYKRQEFHYGTFHRNVRLSKEIDTENLKASYENGILRIVLPKKTETQKVGRKIVIE